MEYEKIYSRSYIKRYDPKFFDDKEYAYEKMQGWLNDIASLPYVRNAFKTLSLDNDLMEVTYELKNSLGKESDDNFVIKLFSDGFTICWWNENLDSVINTAVMIGGKEEKKIKDSYSDNQKRVRDLELKLQKYVTSYGYYNGLVGSE